MGSPLSPALCLMVVSISEQIWHNTFHQLLSNHHLFIRHVRYVDNRLIFGDKRLTTLAPYEVLLDDGFYGKPIILETEPDQEFLGFMLETKPLELIYQGPTNISQVLSPFSASPPQVLSGFRSRCHIVIKGAFPNLRVQQSLSQLIRLYTRAGFPNEELQKISTQTLDSASERDICCSNMRLQPAGIHFPSPLVVCDLSSHAVPGLRSCSALPILTFPDSVWLSCTYCQLSGLNHRFELASFPWAPSWIMLKVVRFTTTWLGQSCISTICGALTFLRAIH